MRAEWPDLVFVEPAAWNRGRPSGRPLWIVVHTTEGSEGLKSAEDGAAYDARREDGTSTHFFCDQNTTVQCVFTGDRANAARGTGNARGIHFELCGRAAQSPAQWHDDASTGTLQQFERQAARVAAKWSIPVRHLTVAQIRDFEPGFVEHNDLSRAFGESDHTDPGKNYPWSETLTNIRAILAPPKEDDVAEIDVINGLEEPREYGIQRIKDRGWGKTSIRRMVEYIFESLVASGDADVNEDGVAEPVALQARLERLEDDVRALGGKLDQVLERLPVSEG